MPGDPSGPGQAHVYLGNASVTVSDPVNPTPFEATFTVSVPIGQDFTATATDSTNDTSQLAVPVTAAGLYTVITTEDNTDPGSLRTVIANANAASTPVTITFAIPTSASSPSGKGCIELLSPLDPITNQVTINGINTLDPNASAVPDVQIDGSVHNVAGDGRSSVRRRNGDVVGRQHDQRPGLHRVRDLLAAVRLETDNNTLTGNWLGIGIPGCPQAGNQYGVEVDGVSGTTIGGTTSDLANLIGNNGVASLHAGAGIFLNGAVRPATRSWATSSGLNPMAPRPPT